MPHALERAGRWLDRTVTLLAALGGLCLLAIVVIVSAGVVMRYAFNAPLLGINEFVQLTAVALVMAALPYCTARNDHVAVDVFEQSLGRWGRFAGDIISRALSGAVLGFLTQRAFVKAMDAWEWGDATNMLRMPIWPFYGILAFGSGLCVIILAVQLVQTIVRGAR
ncbi:MAG: TRAP transporter small permease [Paracoccus sp. (in: a-proteobacteria)]